MSSQKINTYCPGFQLQAVSDVTRQDFVKLCDDLQIKFNDYYKTDKYSFSPECITEGGIIFDNFNSFNNYKTMRVFFTDDTNTSRTGKLYGWINEKIKEEWMNDKSILIDKGSYIGTTLKSFGNAPQWTNNELKIFLNCFSNSGIVLANLPKKNLLKRLDNCKYYSSLFDL